MGSKSDYLEAKVLDHVLGATTFTPPATVYLALFSALPSDSGGGTELTTGTAPGYARVAVTNNATNFPAAFGTSPTSKKLGVAQSFPANSGGSAWPNAIGWAMFDASTGGNLLLHGPMNALACGVGQQVVFPADAVLWTED
jgi:hypothetical protein